MIFHEKKAPQDGHRRRLVASSFWNNVFNTQLAWEPLLRLFEPQRDYRIDPSRTPRGKVTRGESHADQHC
jgi:hypothetical protein